MPKGIKGKSIKFTDCAICNKNFSHLASRADKAKYCSTKCYYIGQRGRGRTTYVCFYCNNEFKGSLKNKRKYCSKACVNKSNILEWKPTFQSARRSLKVRGLLNKCSDCGYSKMPEIIGVHHIDENNKNNSFDNLAILCANCHSERHHKHIVHGYRLPENRQNYNPNLSKDNNMSYTDKQMNEMAEGSKSKGLDAEQAAAKTNEESNAGHSPTTQGKSAEALKILGAGKPHGCTTKAMY